MYQNFAEKRTTWLFIDEVQSLFKHPAVIAYFESFWAEGRKFGLVAPGSPRTPASCWEATSAPR